LLKGAAVGTRNDPFSNLIYTVPKNYLFSSFPWISGRRANIGPSKRMGIDGRTIRVMNDHEEEQSTKMKAIGPDERKISVIIQSADRLDFNCTRLAQLCQ
jgi:hypothetical protein